MALSRELTQDDVHQILDRLSQFSNLNRILNSLNINQQGIGENLNIRIPNFKPERNYQISSEIVESCIKENFKIEQELIILPRILKMYLENKGYPPNDLLDLDFINFCIKCYKCNCGEYDCDSYNIINLSDKEKIFSNLVNIIKDIPQCQDLSKAIQIYRDNEGDPELQYPKQLYKLREYTKYIYIVNKLLTSIYNGKDESCVICLEPILNGNNYLPIICNHVYHFDCLIPHFKIHNNCPICRENIIKINKIDLLKIKSELNLYVSSNIKDIIIKYYNYI
jgi:hypothetical protein